MFFSKMRVLAGLIALSSLPITGPMAGLSGKALAQDADAADAGTADAALANETTAIEDAVSFATSLTEDATEALTKDGASEADKLKAFQGILAEGLALEVIGKFMLGESRKTMSEAQLERYGAVFPDYITRLYASQFAAIVGKPLEVIDATPLGARDVIVRTQFNRADAEPINVDWRIRKLKSGDQKAIDIIVAGVSIMLVKREEFSAFIVANGVDNLLDRLEEEAFA